MPLQNELITLLGIAEFFRTPENRKEKFDNLWTFEKINALLRSWVIPFNPDLKQATFEEVLDFLKGLLPEEIDQTTIPNLLVLEELIEKSELATAKSDEIRQNAILKAEKQIADLYRLLLEKKLVEKLTESPVPPEIKSKLVSDLSENLYKNLEQGELPVLVQKAKNTPQDSTTFQELQDQISDSFERIWQNTVEKTASDNNLSPEQISQLQSISSPVFLVAKPTEVLETINSQRQQLVEAFKTVVFPVFPSEEENIAVAEEISETLINNRVFSRAKTIIVDKEKAKQEITSSLKQLSELEISDKDLNTIIVLTNNIQNAIDQQEKGISRALSPALSLEKAEIFVKEFSKSFPDNLAQEVIEKAAILSVWQMVDMTNPEVKLQPEEIAGIVNLITQSDPREIYRFRSFSTLPKPSVEKENLLELTDNGKTVFRQVQDVLYKQGINLSPEGDKKLTLLRTQLQTVKAIRDGVTEKDIENTIQQLIKSGISENSLQIKELRETQKTLMGFLQKAKTSGFPEKQIQNWQNQGLPSVKLFLSRFNTLLEKTDAFQGLNLFSRLQSKLLSRLSKIKIGDKIIHLFQLKSQKALQKLHSLVFPPQQTKEPTVINFSSLSSRIGRQAFLFVGEKIIPPKLVRNFGEGIASVFTGQNRAVNSFISSSQNLLSSLSSVSLMPTKIGGFLIAGLIAVVILTFVVIFGAGGAMYLPSATTTGRQTSAGGCFTFVGNWSSSEKELINGAVTTLVKYPAFINFVCSRGTIRFIRVNTNDYCSVELTLDINITDRCLGNIENTTYSLSHELSHVLAVNNSDLYYQFLDQVGNAEGFICSYPLTKTYSEDFPETVAVYIMNRIYPNHSYTNCSGSINMTSQYPIHYNFIKGKI